MPDAVVGDSNVSIVRTATNKLKFGKKVLMKSSAGIELAEKENPRPSIALISTEVTICSSAENGIVECKVRTFHLHGSIDSICLPLAVDDERNEKSMTKTKMWNLSLQR